MTLLRTTTCEPLVLTELPMPAVDLYVGGQAHADWREGSVDNQTLE